MSQMAPTRALGRAPGPFAHREIETRVELVGVDEAFEQVHHRAAYVAGGPRRVVDDGTGILALPAFQKLVEQVLAAAEIPVEGRPRNAEAVGQRQHLDLADAALDQHLASQLQPVFAGDLYIAFCRGVFCRGVWCGVHGVF
jgi:hypothetical protein